MAFRITLYGKDDAPIAGEVIFVTSSGVSQVHIPPGGSLIDDTVKAAGNTFNATSPGYYSTAGPIGSEYGDYDIYLTKKPSVLLIAGIAAVATLGIYIYSTKGK